MTVFSQRHYELIAYHIAETKREFATDEPTTQGAVTSMCLRALVSRLSGVFMRDNPSFKPEKFLRASGFQI